jgi:xanthine dehydrogenase small subunit
VIQFSINGQLIKEDKIDPNWTVLRYLRTKTVQVATKEGCAGGDCGACSILVAEKDSAGTVSFQAMNACIALLGSIDGKSIITVEGLSAEGELHPVQTAMVEHHGSQCGFCTPGIVASLAALYQNKIANKVVNKSSSNLTSKSDDTVTEHDIYQALSGNLCRCTGYRPIIEAAKAMGKYPEPSLKAAISTSPVVQFDPIAHQQCENSYLDASIDYQGRKLFVPDTEDQLKTLLKQYPSATLWAGGTDLGLEITQMFKQFDIIICLHKIKSLNKVTHTDSAIRFGAMVSYTDSETHLAQYFPSFAMLIHRIAAVQIRNLGTLGGNVANASPIGDTPPVFMALQTRVELSSSKGVREVGIDDFFTGYKQTAMKKGEYLSALIVPKLASNQHLHVFKVSKRKEDDISAVLMAVRLDNENGKIANARIACGGMAATPLRATKTEASLNGANFALESFEQAAQYIKHDYSPILDVRATPEYRLNVASNLIIKTGLELFSPEVLVTSNHTVKGGH